VVGEPDGVVQYRIERYRQSIGIGGHGDVVAVATQPASRASAVAQTLALQRIKAGHKAAWQAGAAAALALGLAAIGLQVWQLLNLPFFPGTAGYASVFVGATSYSPR
jgi:hypothetical protein